MAQCQAHLRPADAYRARHRSPADAYRAKYRDAGSVQSALAGLRVDGVASASLAGLPDDLWRQICAFGQPATCGCALVVAAGRSASLQHALRAEVAHESRFNAVQARILSQEKSFVSHYDWSEGWYGGYEAFYEITEQYLGILTGDVMNTGVGFDKLVPMLHLHYLTKILTSIGLDREAVGVQLECRADVLKKMMFMIQDHVRKLLQKGW